MQEKPQSSAKLELCGVLPAMGMECQARDGPECDRDGAGKLFPGARVMRGKLCWSLCVLLCQENHRRMRDQAVSFPGEAQSRWRTVHGTPSACRVRRFASAAVLGLEHAQRSRGIILAPQLSQRLGDTQRVGRTFSCHG